MFHYIMDVQANTGILMPTDEGRREGEMFLRNIATDTPEVWSGTKILNRAGNSVPPPRLSNRPTVQEDMLPVRGPPAERHGPKRARSWTRIMFRHHYED